MSKKRLILVGNKPTKKDLSKIIDGFDFVMRVNRMTNMPNTGSKTNGFYVGLFKDWEHYMEDPKYRDFYKDKGQLICWEVLHDRFKNWCDIFAEKQWNNAEKLDYWSPEYPKRIGHRYPTSSIVCLDHILNSHWNDEYDIYITCIDIEGRGAMFEFNPEWNHAHHKYAGYFEEQYIKNLIKENKIHVIPDD